MRLSKIKVIASAVAAWLCMPYAVAQATTNGTLVNGASIGTNAPLTLTASTSGTWSGTVNLTASIRNGASSDSFCFLVDGAFYYQGTPPLMTAGPGCVSGGSSSATFALDTRKLGNGAHQVWVTAPAIGVSRRMAFTTNNTAPYELRAGYGELWLTAGGTTTLAPKLKNTDGSFTTVPLGTITSGSTYPGPLKALYLGAPSDAISPYSLTAPNSIYDFHIRLQGLKAIPTDVVVSNGSRTWNGPTLPINGWYYLKTSFDGAGNGDLWLDSFGSTSFTVQITFPDTSTAEVTSAFPDYAWFESVNPSVASVNQTTGAVTGQAVGDTVVAVGYGGFTTYVLVHVNTANVTPHFGNDGSLLTAYDPAKSLFVRELFFGQPDLTDAQSIADFRAAAVNTVEATLYVGPTSNDYTAWRSYIQNNFWTPVENQVAQGFNVLFTGEELARGDDRLYDSTRGYGHTMTPSPIAAAFTWAKGLGHAIGVDMVDEVSFAFGANPLPQGLLGATNGPQSIACVSNACTVTWPGWTSNGAGRFLITGAVSDTNLNVDINHYYTVQTAPDSSHFTFTASGVGTHTFTAATDPALTIQIFAYAGHGIDGLDYVHNDAFTVLMDTIHTTDGNRPPITWPAAGDTPAAVGPWDGNTYMADYATLYWSFLSKSYPWGSTLLESKFTWDSALALKYPYVQRGRPILWLAPGISSNYVPVSARDIITSITNDTFVFAAPHGVTSAQLAAGVPRFLAAGNSTSALNGKYYVYSVTNATTLKAYSWNIATPALANVPSVPNNVNGTATFSTAGPFALYAYSSDSQSAGFTFAGTCPGTVTGQTVSVSGDSILTALNGTSWYVTSSGDGCNIVVRQLKTGTGTGGYADIIHSNDAPAIGDNGQLPLLRAAAIMWAAAKGLAGTRVYVYSTDFNKVAGWNNMFPGDCTDIGVCGIQNGLSPRYNGVDAVAGWHGMSNAFNLIAQIEPYLLQPKLPSPDYGPRIVTAARTSSYGKMLMFINLAEVQVTETVDLSPYGTSATVYRMSGVAPTSTSTVSGSSTSVTFAPGETVVFTFAP